MNCNWQVVRKCKSSFTVRTAPHILFYENKNHLSQGLSDAYGWCHGSYGSLLNRVFGNNLSVRYSCFSCCPSFSQPRKRPKCWTQCVQHKHSVEFKTCFSCCFTGLSFLFFLMLLPLCDEPLFRYKRPYAAGLNAVAQVRLQHEALASLSPLYRISSSNKDKKA